MMSASAVQIRGAKNVVAAYSYNEAPNFAIFCGKELLTKYIGGDLGEGAERLAHYLQILHDAGSGATYQLRQFDENVKKITNATEWDYSFRFCVGEDQDESPRAWYARINDRMDALEGGRRNILDEDDQDEPAGIAGGVLGVLNGILAKPEVQSFLMNKIGSWFAGKFGGQQGAAMNGVPVTDPGVDISDNDLEAAHQALGDGQRELLDKGLRILISRDPAVGTHIYKIAQILQNDPGKYKMFAGML